MSPIKRLICLTLLLIISALGYTYLSLRSYWLYEPESFSQTITLEIKKGDSLKALSEKLHHFKVINNKLSFYWAVRVFANYKDVQAGVYQFQIGQQPAKIFEKIRLGKVFAPIVFQVTFPEGFNAEKIYRRLAKNQNFSYKTLINLHKNTNLISHLTAEPQTLEGYLYTSTYIFRSQVPSEQEMIRRMIAEFSKQIPKNYEQDLSSLGLSLHQAVIFASLIEKETSWSTERNLVSEVIWNRLRKNMVLGIDAAIIFGIKDYKGNITRAHLKDQKNPYNLRVKRGLPPGPICSPSKASLQAVLNPSNYGYYYYVLLPGQKKRHHFSKTLKEHNQHVQKLVRYQRQSKS